MNTDSSSFDNLQAHSESISTFTDAVPFNKNGATSDCFKVRIFSKWHFLKRPKKAFSNHPLYIAAFEKEFDLGFTLDHPNIVRYLSKGTDKEGIYILSEYIDGLTLNDFRQQNPLYFKKEENIRNVLTQLLSALSYLHNRQIVHLDIKPENILITNNGNNVKLIDLGLSYSDCYNEITGGTRSFGSPEQFSKSTAINQQSDLYAFGKIVLYLFEDIKESYSINHLPNQYKQMVKSCLVKDIELRDITANECLNQINAKPKNPIAIGVITFIGLIVLSLWNKPKEIPFRPKIITKDTVVIHEIIPKKTNVGTLKKNTQTTKVDVHAVATIQPIQIVNISKDSVEIKIRKEVRRSVKSSMPTLTKLYSDLNTSNYEVRKYGFLVWLDACSACCQYLYEDYEKDISFPDFKLIYESEMTKQNAPLQKMFDDFKKNELQKK
jgi:serine/threonine protein kinase